MTTPLQQNEPAVPGLPGMLDTTDTPEQPVNAQALRQQFFHAMTSYKLERVANLGQEALIAPSLAITERPDLLSHHGNIVLIAHHHAFHSLEHQVFSDDAYTPRVPQVTASVDKDTLDRFVSRIQQAYAHFDLSFHYDRSVFKPQGLPLSLSLTDQMNKGSLVQELWVLHAYENQLPLQRVNESGTVDLEFISEDLKPAILDRLRQEDTVDFPLTNDPDLIALFRQGIEGYLAREHADSPRKQTMFRSLAENTYFSRPDALAFNTLCSVHDEMKQASSNNIDWYQTRQHNADSYQWFAHDDTWYHQLLTDLGPTWSIEEGKHITPLNNDSIKRFMAKGVVNTESGALSSYNMIRADATTELTKDEWLTKPLTTDLALFEQQNNVISDGYIALSDALNEAYPFKMTLSWLTQEMIAFHQRMQHQGEQATWRIQGTQISDKLTEQARELIEQTLHLPPKYFEVKTHGLAPLSRFHTAMVTGTLPAHLTELLTRNGVTIKQCDALTLERINEAVNDYQGTQAHTMYLDEYLDGVLQAQHGLEASQLPVLLKEHALPSVFTESELHKALGITTKTVPGQPDLLHSPSAAIAPDPHHGTHAVLNKEDSTLRAPAPHASRRV